MLLCVAKEVWIVECTYEEFDYLVQRRYPVNHNGSQKSSEVLHRVLIGENGENREKKEGVLYLIPHMEDGKPQIHVADGSCLHIVDQCWQKELATQKGYFVFCPYGQILKTMNGILELFYGHMKWLQDVEHADLAEHAVQKLLELGAEYLEADISLVNKSYGLEYSRDYFSFHGWEGQIGEDHRMTISALQDLYIDNPDFDRTYSEKGLRRYPYYEVHNKSLYYYNIFFHGEYLCRILIMTENKKEASPFWRFLTYLCKHIENCYVHVYRQRSENDRYTALRLVLPKLLKGGEISNREQDKLLRQIGWNGKPEYLLVCLTAKGYGNSAPTLAYTCSRLEAALHECCAVQEGNHIFCIQNLSSPGAREHMEQALPEFLRENLFQAGISCIFHSLANLNLYVREAQFALLEGAEKAPDRWIHDFADYRLDYMLERTRSEVPAADLCHPAFQALKDYDRKHPGTELFQTLYQYTVKMFHAADTASALLVHRTTFFYRLRKIQELTPIDFENPDERLLLTLSVKLIPYVFPADKPVPSLPGDRP